MKTTDHHETEPGRARYRLAHHLTFVDDGPSGMYATDDVQAWRVHHPVARNVLAVLAARPDGCSAEELRDLLDDCPSADHPAAQVEVALAELAAVGSVLLVTVDDVPQPVRSLADARRAGRAPEALTGSAPTTEDRTRNAAHPTTLSVVDAGCGAVTASRISAGLLANGFTLTREEGEPPADDPDTGAGSSAALVVVLTRDLVTTRTLDLALAATRAGRQALVMRVNPRGVALGPVFAPLPTPDPAPAPAPDRNDTDGPPDAAGPCAGCLHHHLARNVEPAAAEAREGLDLHDGGRRLRDAGASPAVLDLAAGLLATLLARHLIDGPGRRAHLLILDAVEMTLTRHPVRRRPECPHCGDPELSALRLCAPVRTVPTPVVASSYRAAPAEMFLHGREHLTDPVTGLITHHQDLGDTVGARIVRGRHGVVPDGAGWRSAVALGRGRGRVEAEAALFGEAAERYSTAWHGDQPTVLASADALGERAVRPERISLFSEDQFGRRRLDQEPIPAPLPPDFPIMWTPAHTYPDGDLRYVPTSGVFFGHRDRAPAPYAFPDSNGCAAGSTVAEALVYGLLELIERDAVGIWWYTRARRPEVVDPGARAALDRARGALAAHGRRVWLLDLTTDLGIPVHAAVSARNDPDRPAIAFGFGSHLDPALAAERALGELGQMLAIGPDAARPEHRVRHRAAETFWAGARLETMPYLAPAGPGDPAGARTASPVRATAGGDLHTDALTLAASLTGAGIEVLAQDLTRPDLGIPVVRALAPGLRHFWPRLAPGRLYTVPVALGWLEEPPQQDDLNPLPLFV